MKKYDIYLKDSKDNFTNQIQLLPKEHNNFKEAIYSAIFFALNVKRLEEGVEMEIEIKTETTDYDTALIIATRVDGRTNARIEDIVIEINETY